MAQRTVALCDGKFIGIESIYTVIDGKQINIRTNLNSFEQKAVIMSCSVLVAVEQILYWWQVNEI